ncbi:MAG: hypothetical protein GDA49_12465 [Rhodospirillales bacterium]|nr:hypothetical protein [Rhodospirillales bacterium]
MSDEALNVTNNDLNTAGPSKRKKFVKLAESRTVNALKAIRVIGKLSNRNSYEYGDGDVNKIVKALSDEVEKLKSRMKSTDSSDGIDFKL